MSNIFKIVLCTCAFIRFFVVSRGDHNGCNSIETSAEINIIKGESSEDLKQKYAQIIMTCANDFPLTAADLEQLRSGQLPDDQNIKCLFACAYKKIGMMDEKGQLSVDGVDKISQQYFADNPEKIKKANEFTQACSSVNDLPVSDGDKGCDRAALIFKCSIEKASEFDFV